MLCFSSCGRPLFRTRITTCCCSLSQARCPRLRRLDLRGCLAVTHADLAALLAGCPRLSTEAIKHDDDVFCDRAAPCGPGPPPPPPPPLAAASPWSPGGEEEAQREALRRWAVVAPPAVPRRT